MATDWDEIEAAYFNQSGETQTLLEAFRQVTQWTDAEVLHYAKCDACTPICGHEEYACKNSPQRTPAAGSATAGEDGTVTP